VKESLFFTHVYRMRVCQNVQNVSVLAPAFSTMSPSSGQLKLTDSIHHYLQCHHIAGS
jgi:hypothetical protein